MTKNTFREDYAKNTQPVILQPGSHCMGKISYRSSHGKVVEVTVTQHARIQFSKRWANVFPARPLLDPVDDAIAFWFNNAKRLKVKSRRYRNRLRRHGKDTLYFFASPFVFVVQSTILKTVELGTRVTRHLNNKAPVKIGQIAFSNNPPPVEAELAPQCNQVFRLGAWAFDEGGNLRTVSLGSCYSKGCNGKFESLRDDLNFKKKAILRFEKKWPNLKLNGIFVKLGKKGEVL